MYHRILQSLFYAYMAFLLIPIEQSLAQTTLGCGTVYGCFVYPTHCTDMDCTYIFKWQNRYTGIDFQLYGKVVNIDNNWLGIGFSGDRKMGNDSVVICKTNNDVQTYYNDDKNPVLVDQNNPSFGLSKTSVAINNGYIMCAFTREIRNDRFNNFFDLSSQKYYILAAYGPFSNDHIRPHTNKVVCDSLNDFSIPVIPQTIPPIFCGTSTSTTKRCSTPITTKQTVNCGSSTGTTSGCGTTATTIQTTPECGTCPPIVATTTTKPYNCDYCKHNCNQHCKSNSCSLLSFSAKIFIITLFFQCISFYFSLL